MPGKGSCWFSLVCAVASWLLWRKLSAFLRLTETQMEFTGAVARKACFAVASRRACILGSLNIGLRWLEKTWPEIAWEGFCEFRLDVAGGSKCCGRLEMTVSHNPHFPAAFCDSSRMQICYWRKPIGFPVWKGWTQKKPFAFCERL